MNAGMSERKARIYQASGECENDMAPVPVNILNRGAVLGHGNTNAGDY